MYKIEDKNLIFDDNKIFRVLPPLDFGSTCDIYKMRICGNLYAVKVFRSAILSFLSRIAIRI